MAGVQRSGIDRCVMRLLKGLEMAQNMSLADQVIQSLADVRQIVLGYAIAFSVAMALLSLITGQGPNSHYGP